MRTISEIQTDLTTINSALQSLIAGKRVTQLRIGSGDFIRDYHYQQLTYEFLKAEQAELTQELARASGTQELVFRQMTNVPLTVNKFRS